MTDMIKWMFYWRIASASAALPLGRFTALGLPPVNVADYRPFTQEIPRSTGGVARQGHKNISLLWYEMTYNQLKTLTKIVDASVTGGVVYATIDRSFGVKLANDFIDISGVPHPLTFSPIADSWGAVVQNVNLIVTNITITADPSSVI